MICGPFILFISLVLSLWHPNPQKWVSRFQSQGDKAWALAPMLWASVPWLPCPDLGQMLLTLWAEPQSLILSHGKPVTPGVLSWDTIYLRKAHFKSQNHVRGAGFSLQHESFHAECHIQGPLASFKARELGRRPANKFPLLHRLQFPFCL